MYETTYVRRRYWSDCLYVVCVTRCRNNLRSSIDTDTLHQIVSSFIETTVCHYDCVAPSRKIRILKFCLNIDPDFHSMIEGSVSILAIEASLGCVLENEKDILNDRDSDLFPICVFVKILRRDFRNDPEWRYWVSKLIGEESGKCCLEMRRKKRSHGMRKPITYDKFPFTLVPLSSYDRSIVPICTSFA